MRDKVILTDCEVKVDDVLNQLSRSEECGALVIFIGNVKGLNDGKRIHELVIEMDTDVVYEVLSKLREDTIRRYDIQDLVVAHREGVLNVGDNIVVIAVLSRHREEGFEACKYFINELKHLAPIWKLEKREDGAHWVGSEWLR